MADKEKKEEKNYYPRIKPDQFEGRDSDIRQDVMWAYRYMAYLPKDIRKEDWKKMPGPGALMWLKQSQGTKGEIGNFLGIVAKLLPSAKELDEMGARRDDGRELGQMEKQVANAAASAKRDTIREDAEVEVNRDIAEGSAILSPGA